MVNFMLYRYRPITSTPYLKSSDYCEIPPCRALAPYVCCFWGSESSNSARLVIPDTCMDIIIMVVHSNNTCTASFCALDDRTYQSSIRESKVSTFGIRFFGWSAMLFTSESFKNTKNNAYLADDFFHSMTSELIDTVFRFDTLIERAGEAEKILLSRLSTKRFNSDLMNVINDMITFQSRMKISEIAGRNVISERKMQRLFEENVGVTPKTFSDIIRYQLVWQEVARGSADILDMVEKYGYTDQAHLLNDFRKRHGMTPKQAFSFAMSDFYKTV